MKKSNTEVAAQDANTNVIAFDPNALKAGIAKSREISPPGHDGADIMKVSGDGEVTLGMDRTSVDATEEWRVSPANIYQGFICWKEGKPVEQVHRSLIELATMPAYTADDLTDHGPYTSEMDGWSEQSTIGMQAVKDGLLAVFPTTAQGGRQAISKVVDAIGKKVEEDSDYVIPVLTVTADSYFNKKFRKDIYFPVFTVVRWENMAGETEV